MRACCERRFGTRDLKGRSVAVVGAGRVGSRLARAARARRGEADRLRHRRVQARAGEVARRAMGGPEHRPARRGGRRGAVRAGRRDRPGGVRAAALPGGVRLGQQPARPRRPGRGPRAPTAILFAPDFIASAGGSHQHRRRAGGLRRRRGRGGGWPGIEETMGEVLDRAEAEAGHAARGGLRHRPREARRRYRGRMTVSPVGRAIAANLAEIVGGTPMVELTRVAPDCGAELVAKLEAYNPGGQREGPDRRGDDRRRRGARAGSSPGRTTIVEATSGNTGIALAFVCAARGYELVLAMPQGMSREREGLLRLYGAEVEITESMGGMNEAVEAAQRIADERRRRLHPRPVLQPREPGDPPPHDRRGDLARHGRQGRRARGRRRHRRHDHRRGRAAEGAQPRPAGGGGRARELRRCSPAGKPGPHKIQGIGAGLRAGGAQPRRRRRDPPGGRRGRDRDRARLRAAREGVLAGHLLRRGAVGARSRSARGPRCAASGSRSIMPDSGERYVSTPVLRPR